MNAFKITAKFWFQVNGHEGTMEHSIGSLTHPALNSCAAIKKWYRSLVIRNNHSLDITKSVIKVERALI